MRNKQLDVFGASGRRLEHFARDLSHRTNRDFEQLVPLHLEKVIAGRERFRLLVFGACRRRVKKLLFITSVRFDLRRENAAIAFTGPNTAAPAPSPNSTQV